MVKVASRNVGDGDLVRDVGFVGAAHPADLGKGVSVYCGEPDADHNDIHIDLVESLDNVACQSITAETMPLRSGGPAVLARGLADER